MLHGKPNKIYKNPSGGESWSYLYKGFEVHINSGKVDYIILFNSWYRTIDQRRIFGQRYQYDIGNFNFTNNLTTTKIIDDLKEPQSIEQVGDNKSSIRYLYYRDLNLKEDQLQSVNFYFSAISNSDVNDKEINYIILH